MKAAFNIPPAITGNSSLHLLIEAGSYGISFIWFRKDAFFVEGIMIYNISDGRLEDQLKIILDSEAQLLAGLSSITISYNFKESLLVPEKFNYTTDNEKVLSLLYDFDSGAFTNHDLITSAKIYNYYRVPESIKEVLSARFPGANIFHSTSLQLEQMHNTNDGLYCIIFHNSFKVFLFKENKLQLVQQFNYVSSEDVVYHLLNVCEQHYISPLEVQLKLTGMIEEDSALYAALYKYFVNITFENDGYDSYLHDEIRQLPPHFFSHLTALALCVS